MTINSNRPRKKGVALRSVLLSITLITATLYVCRTITAASGAGYFVGIGVTGYSPSSLTISKGDFVTWSNEDRSGSLRSQ
jgi:plastocyanin